MRFRIWLIFIGFTTIMLGFLYVNQIALLPYFYEFVKTQETTSTMNLLKRQWNNGNIQNLLTDANRLAQEQDMRIEVNFYNHNEFVTILKDPGNIFSKIPSAGDNERYKLFAELLNDKNGIITSDLTYNGRQVLIYNALVGSNDDILGYITIHNFLLPPGNTQDVLASQFFLSSCVLLLLAVLLSTFVTFNISNPIIKISQSAKKLVTGDFNMKTKKADYVEIKTLTNNLNKASSEIAKTENLRKDLLANVSHDLKTPLTMIKAYAEMIRDLSGNNPEKRGKHVQVIIDEADRLNGLVVAMLDLSKLQSGVAKKESSLFNFSEDLNDIIKRFDYLSDEHGITIIPDIQNEMIIKADISQIEQVVYNFVNNAINHAGDDGKVTVSLFIKKAGIGRFEVKDNGSGIAKEEIPYIWERYYKAEKSVLHKRTTVGTGLGLSIVKGIMELHGFAYGVDSALGRGSTFWFEFPCE
ncbi:MAG: HAMP domain-containing histidine kinase [Oscillospiraceae bacterium]|nr:HAMP domain-containing histidine kinase [Oscillospiraceae bacterium]